MDSITFAPGVEDPEKSRVAGKVGSALHPAGVRRSSQTGGFGIAIPSNAENKEAVFLLMQGMTPKKGDKLFTMAGGNPSRFSAYADPEVQAKYPFAPHSGKHSSKPTRTGARLSRLRAGSMLISERPCRKN